MRAILVVSILFSISLPGQERASSDPPLSGPILGFVHDRAADAIRPVQGIPGAATLGPAIDVGFPVAAAWFSPAGHALSLSDDGRLYVVDLRAATVVPVENAMATPGRILFSSSGNAALLYSEAARRLQMVSGLPARPVVRELDFPAPDAQPLAVSDDEAALLAAGDVAWLAASGRAPVAIRVRANAAAFRRGARDALMASGDGTLYRIDSGGGAQALPSSADAPPDPAELRLSADGAFAFVAGRAGLLSRIEIATGAAASVDCHCSPAALEPFASGTVFRISDLSGGPLWLLDGSEPRVWFVPALPAHVGRSRRGK
jgi:hypothetical protein